MRTIAEMVATHYGDDDGSRVTGEFNRVIHSLATEIRRNGGERTWRYVFRDGSAIVVSEFENSAAWDVEGAEPFSWRGK